MPAPRPTLARVALIVLAAVLLGAVTVLLMIALPPDLRPWLIPILMVAALSWRAFGGRR